MKTLGRLLGRNPFILCGILLLVSARSATAYDCGSGFAVASSHGAFYRASNAGRFAYVPLAQTPAEARRAQIFCVFTDAVEYTLRRRPEKMVFVLNNMKTAEEPAGISFFVVRFVRRGSGRTSPAIELWKSESSWWRPETTRRRNFSYSGETGERDKFLGHSLQTSTESEFERQVGVDIHGTTQSLGLVPGYSTWEERGRISSLAVRENDGVKISVLAFPMRSTPPDYRSAEDRDRRIVFEITIGAATSLEIETLGPAGQSPGLSRIYRLQFAR
jgi:hypothetical protein